jgi:hypothetical protein
MWVKNDPLVYSDVKWVVTPLYTFNSEDSNTVSGAWFKTNAEIAKELGVSKRQASKLKRKDIDRYT